MRAIWRSVRSLLPVALLGVMFSVGRSEQASPGRNAAQEPNAFTLYAADDGALKWDDLTPAEQAAATGMKEWGDRNAAAVHSAFSAAVAQTAVARELHDAQVSSGLEGVETLGVVP